MEESWTQVTDEEVLEFHTRARAGKLEVVATKPLTTQRDLSLAYSPGVAVPCLRIQQDPSLAYDYTAKGNLVAVISNGTAVLGLGNLGALAAKPVMEGKAVLFKRFADIDSIDLEVDTAEVDEFVNCTRLLGPSFGGINLEDIKAPDCFVIEQRLREQLDIPVFHDDQHGTAIIAAAGLLNAFDLTGRDLRTAKIVISGAGASAIACCGLFQELGIPKENIILCDTKGVIFKGRDFNMNQWKQAQAVSTSTRTLSDAMENCDVFLGLSVKGAVTSQMIELMAPQPIVFALANPDPEILPEQVLKVRPDAIVATGRSDYPNQINNVLCFPYIFRGALDVRATTINSEMKIAAAHALADLTRKDVPDKAGSAYQGRKLRYGRDYIIPVPFDPRLIVEIPLAVARAAIESGVARKIRDMESYRTQLRQRLDPTEESLQLIFEQVRGHPRRVVFTEGEEERTIRAAWAFHSANYGTAILIGRKENINERMADLGLLHKKDVFEVHSTLDESLAQTNRDYTDYLYRKLQRNGAIYRDCERMVNRDRNVLGALMVVHGKADAMVTGLTRTFISTYEKISSVIDLRGGSPAFGLTLIAMRGRTVFLADTLIHAMPQAETIADIAIQSAAKASQMGHTPRVALLSSSSFGQRTHPLIQHMRQAVEILDQRAVDFEYDGELSAEVALDYELMKRLYPFCRLTAAANVLIMPTLQAAGIAANLLQKVGGGQVIGPVLMGLAKPAQIVTMDATVEDIVTAAVLAGHDSLKTLPSQPG